MKEKIAKLIDVKSIMTLMLTLVFCVLALLGTISAEQFLTIFTVIVGFYFGTQSVKKKAEDAPKPEMQSFIPEQGQTENAVKTVTEDMAKKIHPPDSDQAEQC